MSPRYDYAFCKDCGRHRLEVGLLSQTRLCADCGIRRLDENIIGLATHSGEPMRRWRRGMILCAGGGLLDDLRESA